eukprot:tig00001086_g6869.t1
MPAYQLCTVCRRNHEEGKRHVYSKKHQQKLAKVLQNDLRRIDDIRFFLSTPAAKDASAKEASPFWCRFCEVEVKDGPSRFHCVRHIQHLASWEHNRRVWDFWREQNAPKDLREKFYLQKAAFDEFVSRIGDEGLLEQDPEAVAAAGALQAAAPSEPAADYTQASSSRVERRAATSGASAPREGNVHTGAIPPWMLDDDEDEAPSALPAPAPAAPPEASIGAKRKAGAAEEEDDGWLPSFGRVFNDGPRSASRREFHDELAPRSAPAPAPPQPADWVAAWRPGAGAAAAEGAASGEVAGCAGAAGGDDEGGAAAEILYYNPRIRDDEEEAEKGAEPEPGPAPPDQPGPQPAPAAEPHPAAAAQLEATASAEGPAPGAEAGKAAGPSPAAAEAPAAAGAEVEAQEAAIEQHKAALRARLRAARGGAAGAAARGR